MLLTAERKGGGSSFPSILPTSYLQKANYGIPQPLNFDLRISTVVGKGPVRHSVEKIDSNIVFESNEEYNPLEGATTRPAKPCTRSEGSYQARCSRL